MIVAADSVKTVVDTLRIDEDKPILVRKPRLVESELQAPLKRIRQ